MTSVSNMVITSDADTSKYLTLQPYTMTFSSASASVGMGAYVQRTYTIPLSRATKRYSLWVNISLDGGSYVKMPNPDRRYGSMGERSISVTVSQSGSDLTLNIYLVNQSGTTQTFPSFDINVIRRDYLDS